MIVEAHPLCKVFNDLPEFKYIVARKDNIREIDTKIKKKIGESNKNLANQSVFLFTEKKVLNRGTFGCMHRHQFLIAVQQTQELQRRSAVSLIRKRRWILIAFLSYISHTGL